MSPHHQYYPPYPPFLAPRPHPPNNDLNDLTTLIALRDFVSGALAFRRPVIDFPTFQSLFLAAYAAWQNYPDDYRLHLHFRRGVDCSRNELLEREDWENGEYFIVGCVEVFAHFMEKMDDEGAPVPARYESYDSQPWYGSTAARQPGLKRGRGAGTDSQRRPPPRNDRPRRRQNPDASTVYSLCMLSERQYFSAPFVFIPCSGSGPTSRSFPLSIGKAWPGFCFPGHMQGHISQPVARGSTDSQNQQDFAAPEALAATRVYTPIESHIQALDSESSEDRMSSPEYGVEVKPEPEPEQSPLRESAALAGADEPEMDCRASEGLFVSEEPIRGGSAQSEGLFCVRVIGAGQRRISCMELGGGKRD